MAIGVRPRFREGGTVILISGMAVQMLSGNVVALSSVQLTMRYTGARLGSFVNILMDYLYYGPTFRPILVLWA